MLASANLDTQTPADYFNKDYAYFSEHPAHGGPMLELN